MYASKKRFYVQLLVSVQILWVIKKLSHLIIDDIVNPLSVKDFVIINCMLLANDVHGVMLFTCTSLNLTIREACLPN